MTIYLIRHGKTEANEKHLYCGSTDLPLSEAGRGELQGVHYEITVEQGGFDWIIHSTQKQNVGELIGMNIGPEEIHIMKRMRD